KLVFGQQPTGAAPGAVISPAVTVQVQDAFGNLVTSDNTRQVTVALANNPTAATLSGTTTATVSGGVATFGTLSVNKAGTGYTLRATSGTLLGATSAAFNITAGGSVIEDFESSHNWFITDPFGPTAFRASWAAHNGTYGLDDYEGNDWIFRNDAGAQVKAGDT